MTGVEDDSRALNITIHKPASSPHSKPFPILQATFIFSDHIRCIIAKQRLAKGRIQARRMKMQRIAGEWWPRRSALCHRLAAWFSRWPREPSRKGHMWFRNQLSLGERMVIPRCLISGASRELLGRGGPPWQAEAVSRQLSGWDRAASVHAEIL